jgi:integrase
VSAAYTRKGKTIKTVKVPTRSGSWVQRTTSTRDPVTAERMQRMITDLGTYGERAWDIFDRVEKRSLSIPALYDLWVETKKDLKLIRERLDDVDIEPFVAEWHKTAATSGKKKRSADTVAHYLNHIRKLIPEGALFPRTRFTSERIQLHIDALESSAATKRKAAAAFSSFTVFLSRRGLVPKKLMRDVELPAAADPRMNYLSTEEAKALADAQPGQYRAFSALLAGSGIDVSVAIALRRRDVEAKHREIRAPGTKTYNRDRIIRVAEWAWEYIEPLLPGLLPDARIFNEIPDRWHARDVHVAAIKGRAATESSPATQGLEEKSPIYRGYTMRDQRHTYAVRAIRAGTPAELVARQLGHANAVLVHKVYGRFIPAQEERDRWEKIAHAQDETKLKKVEKGAP